MKNHSEATSLGLSRSCDAQVVDYVNWLFARPGCPWPGNKVVEHAFWLRKDYKLVIQLPKDLRDEEVRRVATMLETLPLGGE